MIWARTVEDTLVMPAPQRPSSAVRVQPAGDREAVGAAELLAAVAREPEGTLLSTGDVDVRRERRRVRALRGSQDGTLLVALRDGEVVGRLDAARDLHPAAAHVAEIGLVVARDARRQGVGSALIDGLRGWCREVGITRLELHVFPGNDASLQFFRRHGFVEEGLRGRRFVRDGVHARRHPDVRARVARSRLRVPTVGASGIARRDGAPVRPARRPPSVRASSSRPASVAKISPSSTVTSPRVASALVAASRARRMRGPSRA